MRPLSERYNATTYSTTMGRNFFTSGTSSSNLFSSRGYSVNAKPKSKTESKEVAAKKHSDAERRRRLRINYQFEALRTILPNLIKVSLVYAILLHQIHIKIVNTFVNLTAG